MASQYSEDIGYIKATLEIVRAVQEEQGINITYLMDDAKFRRRVWRYAKITVLVMGAIATAKFGDIKGLFHT